VAMSINSLTLVGVLRPSLLTRSRQVVPVRNASMMSESVMLGVGGNSGDPMSSQGVRTYLGNFQRRP
jgi:hypothetical protein